MYITVKCLDRFPPSSSTMFKLQEDEWEIDAEAVVARQVQLLPALARRTRSSGSSTSLLQLSVEETSRLELAAEESFVALELEVTGRKRGRSRKEPEDVQEEKVIESKVIESDEEVVEKPKKKAKQKQKKSKASLF